MSDSHPLSAETIREFAHEVRAPLGGIEAMVEMLESTTLDEGQMRMVAALKASVGHLRVLANGVLANGAPGEPVSATATGGRQPLGKLLGEIAVSAEARARAKGLTFCLSGPDEALSAVFVEAHGLRQVIENLIDNAVRLTPSGGIDLHVERQGAGRIAFRLVDDGPGIGSADAARLIREGGAIEGRQGGAGIGLSIAGRLVAKQGGTLSGGMQTGRGAVFRFDWPLEADAPRGACLIVDDHPASRLVMRTILGAAGYTCIEATQPDEALALIARQRPDIVLTDLNMPNGGGAALISRLSAMSRAERPAIVVVSADEIAPTDPLHAEIDGMIRKPIAVRAVLETVGNLRDAAPRCAA